MLFANVNDFYDRVKKMERLSRDEEKRNALLMQAGNLEARERIVESYMHQVASHIKRMSGDHQSLELVYRCVQALEKAVDSFDFEQDGETFTHRLSFVLRQESVRYIADRS